MQKKKAFTLTELLIALGIIGAIAAVSIPSLMSNINNRILASQLKNNVIGIQQIIDEQLTRNKTTSLLETDFRSPNSLLTEANFSVAKICPAGQAHVGCWNVTENATPYKWLSGGEVRMNDSLTLKLKSGALIAYYLTTAGDVTYEGVKDRVIGAFDIDVNGNEGPNVIGRDFFSFFVTDKGKIVDKYYNKSYYTLNMKKAECKGNAFACFGAVVDDGWKINY